jgi:hypothetical protein
MQSSADSPEVTKRKAHGRSRVGNGSAVLPGVDGRSAVVRRYREILNQLISDMGGDPSEAQSLIARRAATIAVWCEETESTLANGGAIDISEFTTATNALRRLLSDIGLDRRARDVSPTIQEIIARHAAAEPAA